MRLLKEAEKDNALRALIGLPDPSCSQLIFYVQLDTFRDIPGSPFSYWVSDQTRGLFSKLVAFEADGRIARIGLTTHDDFRWLRLSWEVGPDRRWVPYAKGGSYSPYYADLHLVIDWGSGGMGLKTSKLERMRRGELTGNNSRCWNEEQYFRPGITWPRRTNGLSFRPLPRASIFGDKGPGVFVEGDSESVLLPLLALMNSSAFGFLVSIQLARTELAQSFEVGVVRTTPVPELEPVLMERLASLALEAWCLKRSSDSKVETSLAFVVPDLVSAQGASIADATSQHAQRVDQEQERLQNVQQEVDDLCFAAFGLEGADREVANESSQVVSDLEPELAGDADPDDTRPDGGDLSSANAARGVLTAELVSWCVGVGFGRFDVRLATGERQTPAEPDPFDPLPLCSPGMLTGDDGLPLDVPPAGYPIAWPVDGVLVDDPGHPRDLTSAVRGVFDVVFGDDADRFWAEAAELVDPKGQDLHRWLAKSFFSVHIRRYSKSRRKAPIYWQLGTASGSYAVWLYAHRVSPDTLYQVLNDLVGPKLQAEERKLAGLVQEAGPTPTAGQRKELAGLEGFVEELRLLEDEVARVAPLWDLDLNDGVVVSSAPLWRLVPQHKPWQKELKAYWDALCAGKCDWAQLAMHLWPERVVPKCAADRSLAIAHDLEGTLWQQDADGTWQTRAVDRGVIDELIADRTSPATRSALQSLLSAPTSPTSGRGRPSRHAGNGGTT